MSATLNIRSKIAIRWTTAPADMGYDGRPTDWMTSAPEMRSPRGALDFGRDLDQRVGQGVYRLISYQHRGREVTAEELEDVVYGAEYDRLARARKL